MKVLLILVGMMFGALICSVVTLCVLALKRPAVYLPRAGSIAFATAGLAGAPFVAMLYLFAKTWPMDDPIPSATWTTLLLQAAGIGFVCLLPFAVVSIALGRKAIRNARKPATQSQ